MLLALVVLAVAATAAVLLSRGPRDAAEGQPHRLLLGVNMDPRYLHRAQLGIAARGNLRIVRFATGWQLVQPYGPDEWRWHQMDRLVAAAKAAGEKIIFRPTGSTCWAHPSVPCPTNAPTPPDPAYYPQYETYIERVLRRYPSMILGVELWNEPNLQQYWGPTPDPVRYAALLKVTYEAVKRVDPSMPVVFGGLAPAEGGVGNIDYASYLERAYAAGAGDYFDVLGFHAYSLHRTSPDYLEHIRAMLDRIVQISAASGRPDIPIWITEFGYPTSEMSPRQQKHRLISTIDLFTRYPNVRVAIINTLFDDPAHAYPGQDTSFGLISSDGRRPRPAYCALLRRAGRRCAYANG